jgi:hypothetical protein
VLSCGVVICLRQLGTAAISAAIGRVDHGFDYEQDDVVVDIETTDGWVSSGRITEIGAVGDRGVSSVLKPQRSFPQ